MQHGVECQAPCQTADEGGGTDTQGALQELQQEGLLDLALSPYL